MAIAKKKTGECMFYSDNCNTKDCTIVGGHITFIKYLKKEYSLNEYNKTNITFEIDLKKGNKLNY
jgi:hypothetical protein